MRPESNVRDDISSWRRGEELRFAAWIQEKERVHLESIKKQLLAEELTKVTEYNAKLDHVRLLEKQAKQLMARALSALNYTATTDRGTQTEMRPRTHSRIGKPLNDRGSAAASKSALKDRNLAHERVLSSLVERVRSLEVENRDLHERLHTALSERVFSDASLHSSFRKPQNDFQRRAVSAHMTQFDLKRELVESGLYNPRDETILVLDAHCG